MSPEVHRAILLRALANGDWQHAERATRARAWRHFFRQCRAFLVRLRRA